jgi:hypothetical protein
MAKIKTARQARAELARLGRTLMVTHGRDGAAYGLDTGQAMPATVARQLQTDLFVQPAEDGLFPGHSQTWRIEG